MEVREKLVELLSHSPSLDALYGYPSFVESAEWLIAHGVTVQNGEDNNIPTKWISVKDRLPIEEAKAHEQEWCGEYCEFLVMIERGLLSTTLYYDWEENEWFRINTALERETYKVTHWMPLPKPPKGE